MERNTSHFDGKSIVTTCLMPQEEDKVADCAAKCGSCVKGAVSGKTDYLVVSDTNLRQTTKYVRAKELIKNGTPIQIVGYAEFLKMVEEDIALLQKESSGAPASNDRRQSSRPEDFVIEGGILKAYSGKSDVVAIPDGVKYIGAGAFALKKMGEVIIPEGVTEIRKDAFKDCRQLKAVILPQSLEKISSYVFSGCRNLALIDLPERLTEIGEAAFADCISLREIRIPDGVAEIKRNTFKECGAGLKGYGAMREVVLPARLRLVRENAFPCSISKLVLNGDDPKIERYAFTGIISELVVGEGIKSIPGYTFNECGKIQTITFLSKETKIGSSAFDARVLPMLVKTLRPSQLNTAMRREFAPSVAEVIEGGKAPTEEYKAEWLKSIMGQKNSLEEEIGDNKALRDIMLREKLVSAKCAGALLEKTQDNELKMQLMEYIGKLGTAGTDVTDEMDIDKGPTLAEVRKNFKLVLDGDTATITGYKGKDSEVVIPSMAGNYRITAIGNNVFKGKNIRSVFIPDSVTELRTNIYNQSPFFGSSLYNDHSNWENGVLYIGNVLIAAEKSVSGVYNVKPGTRLIADSAFTYCNALTAVTIPDGVMIIGISAFSSCRNLMSVSIPDSVTFIDMGAFCFCSSLTELKLPNGLIYLERMIQFCPALERIYIPGSVRKIEEDNFIDCPRLTIHAPAGSCAEKYAKEKNIPFVAE